MLKKISDKRILIIAFILMLFIAIPCSFAGDSSAIDTTDSSSDALVLDDVVSVDSDSSTSISDVANDDNVLNESSGVEKTKDATALGANKLSDGTPWTIQGGSSYATLAAAVAAASSGDTIIGAPGTEESVTSTIQINKNLNIIASNSGDVLLKAESSNTNSIINISSGNKVKIDKIDFGEFSYSASSYIRGASIQNWGILDVTNCNFKNMTLSGNWVYAPAIYNYGNLTVDNCLFDSLTAYYGAAIYGYYSGSILSNNTILNSIFSNLNTPYASQDSVALYFYRNNLNKVTNCTFKDMSTIAGMIYINTVDVDVTNCTFKNIYVSGSSSSLYSAILKSQQTTNNINFIGNYIENVGINGSTTGNGGVNLVMSRAGNSYKVNISNNVFVNSYAINNAAASTYSYIAASIINMAGGNANGNVFINNTGSAVNNFYDLLAFGSVNGNYNYWGSNDGPNSSSHSNNVTLTNWLQFSIKEPEDTIFVDDTADISVIAKVYDNTTSSLVNLPEGSGTIRLSVDSTLNDIDSFVSITDGSGTISYYAENDGDEKLTLVTGDSVEFEVVSDTSNFIYVDTSYSGSTQDGTTDNPFKTIAQALSVSNGATETKTIIIRAGTYSEKDLEVTNNVTIKADKNADVIIDANKEGRIFIVNDATLTLKDLTLINGLPDYYDDDAEFDGKGGAILVSEGSLIANNINVYNSSSAAGGAIASIAVSTGILNITNSKFQDNSIDEEVYYEVNGILGGGAIYSDADNLIITACTFINNQAKNDEKDYVNGGAIYVVGDATIGSSTFTENNATREGGAIYVSAYNTADITISGNTFTSNEAGYNGGVISAETAKSVVISGNTFTSNKAYYGGAIYTAANNVPYIISNNNFNSNSATAGGSIYQRYGILTLTGNTIGTSTATTGSKIYVSGGTVNAKVTYIGGTTKNVDFGEDVNLTATITDDQGNDIKGGSITFTADGTTIATVDISFTGEPQTNYTVPEDAEDDIVISGSWSLNRDGTVVSGILHPTISYWTIGGGNGYETLAQAIADANDGDVIYYSRSSDYNETINGITINKALTIKNNGTGIVTLDGNKNKMFTISSNTNLINLNLINGGSTGGGFITLSGANLYLTNSSLKGISSTSAGGAISVSSGNLTIEGSTFENLSSSAHAPAISATQATTVIQIKDSIFNNITGTSDYSLMETKGNLTIEYSNFTNINGKYTSNWYGAIGSSGNLTVIGCQFSNIVGGDGSSIYYSGSTSVNITKSIFINNSMYNGAIRITSSPSSAFIQYNIFMNNTAASTGATGISKSTASANVNANYNYWGNNSQPTTSVITTVSNASYWTILDLSSSSDIVFAGTTNPITVGFTKYTDGAANYTLADSMPDYTFDLTSTAGTINSTVTTTNGVATAIYLAPSENLDEVTITANPGNAQLVLSVMDTSSLIVVATDGVDSDATTGTMTDPYATIAYALNKVTETRNTIYIKSGIYTEHGITITKDVVIKGEGKDTVIIDAQGEDRIFNINTNNIEVNITSLTLTNGCADTYEDGGAISAKKGTLNIDNVIISNSKADNGGAIYLTTNATISNSEFNNNSAENGAAIYFGDNGDATATINNNIFNLNNASNRGGAIYADTVDFINLTSNTFEDNVAGLDGGSIYLKSVFDARIDSNTFDGSVADSTYGKGGAISIYSSYVRLVGNTITDSSAKYGNAIYVEGSSEVYGAVVTFLGNNTVGGEVGSEITLYATVTDDMGNNIVGGSVEFIVNGTSIGSTTYYTDGLINKTYTIPEDVTEDILVSGSYSLANEDTMVVKTGMVHPAVLHWFIEGKSGYEFLADAVAASENGDVIYGLPGTYDISSQISLTNKEITIRANETGEIILNSKMSKLFYLTRSNLTIENIIMQNGSYGSNGLLIRADGYSNLVIENCTLRDSAYSASSYGSYGSLIYTQSNLTIKNTNVNNINGTGSYAYGGVVYVTGGKLDVTNSNFTNIKSSGGSAFYIYTSNVNIDDCLFENLTANGIGGAFSTNMRSNTTVNNSVFINCLSTGSGGAISSSGTSLNVYQSVFINNRMSSTSSSYGGAIHVDSSSYNINYNIFLNNSVAKSANTDADIYVSSSASGNANYNYFGSNDKPTTAKVGSYVTLNNWVILDLSINETPMQGSSATITIDLSKYTTGTTNSSLTNYLKELSFDISALLGSTNPVSVTLNEDNQAKATVTYNADSIGDETVTLSLLGAPVANLTFTVTPDTSTTIYVNATGSDETGDGSQSAPYASITEALKHVSNDKNIIYVADGTYTENSIAIDKNVTIVGEENVIIDAEGNSNIFNISEDLNVTLQKLSLTNATVASGSGLIYTKSAVELKDISITDVEGTNIYTDGVNFDVILTFLDGRTKYALVGSETVINATVTDVNGFSIAGGTVEFTLNGVTNGTATVGDNGIATLTVALSDDYTNYVVSGSYSNNIEETVTTGLLRAIQFNWFIGENGYEFLADAIADAKTGDIITAAPGYREVINNITIEGKNITIKPNAEGTITLDGDNQYTSFTVKAGAGLTLINMTLINGYSKVWGGLYVNGTLDVINCTFANNTANIGGAIFSHGNSVVNVVDSLFENNIGLSSGGAIYQMQATTKLNVNNTIFIGNKGAGSVYLYGNSTINNSKFINGANRTVNTGGIYINSGNVTITNTEFINNTGSRAADIYAYGGSSGIYNAIIENCKFINSTVNATSGPVAGSVLFQYYNGTVKNSYFENINTIFNTTSSSTAAGAILSSSYSGTRYLNVTNSVFVNCHITAGSYVSAAGAIYVGLRGNINYNIFMNNSAGCYKLYSANDISYNTATGYVNINYNYFGSNDKPTVSTSTVVGNVNGTAPTYWIIVDASLNESEVVLGNNYTLDLVYKVTNGNTITDLTNDMPNYAFDVSTLIGNLNESSVIVSKDISSFTYTPTDVGNENITVAGISIPFTVSGTTSIDAKDGNVVYGEGVYKATLNNDLGPVADKTLTMLINGETLTATTNDVGVAVFNLSSLPMGTYENVVITFADEEFYEGSTATVTINVITLTSTNLVADEDEVEYGFGEGTISATLTDENGTALKDKVISIVIGNISLTETTNENGVAVFDISEVPIGVYETEFVFNTDDYYLGSTADIKITINKLSSYLEYETSNNDLIVTLTNEAGYGIENQIITVTIANQTLTATTNDDGVAIISLEDIPAGIYEANISYVSDEESIYGDVSEIGEVVVSTDTEISISYDNNIVTIVLTDAEGNPIEAEITYTINNGEEITTSTNAKGIATITVDLGKSVVDVWYDGSDDGVYLFTESKVIVIVKNITVDVPTSVNATISLESDENAQVTATVKDLDGNAIANADVNVIVNGETTTKTTDENGIVVIDAAVNATVTVIYTDSTGANASATIIVVENNNTETVDVPVLANATVELTSGDDSIVIAVKDLDGAAIAGASVDVTVDGVTTTLTVGEDGTLSIPVEGNATVTVTYTDPITKASVSNSIVKVIETEIENQTIYVPVVANGTIDIASTDEGIEATLTDSEGNPIVNATIEAIVNGEATNLTTDENGKVTIPVDGNSTVEVSYTDPENGAVVKYATKVVTNTEYVNQTVEVPVVANGTIDIASTDDGIEATLADSEGNPIANATIEAIVNGEAINLTTDENGKLTIPVDGNSTVALTYTDPVNNATVAYSTKVITNTVVENQTIIVTPNRTATKIIYEDMKTTAVNTTINGRIGEYFVFYLQDINGNALANKFIQVGFNGKVYNRTTDENGMARLQINLKNKGTYTFAIGFVGDDNYTGSFEVSKISVSTQKAKLTTANKAYKASAKTKTLTATFKATVGDAKVIAGKKVTFTVNGKTYSATTNAKGVATVKVSLNTKGTYSFTAKFAGDNTFAAATASGKLTIK